MMRLDMKPPVKMYIRWLPASVAKPSILGNKQKSRGNLALCADTSTKR
jgi:hypothetical protein